VTRGYDGSTPRSFNAGDNIYLNVTSVIIEDIQDEVTRLETDKLDISDFNSTLRNNLGNWKVIYTNGTGDETELTLWSAGQFLKSNGATSAPEWESPTVDINWLTEDNDVLDNDDMLVYYDGTGNKKRKAKATITQEGLVEMATDAEAVAGTDETRYTNSKQLHDNISDAFWARSTVLEWTTYQATTNWLLVWWLLATGGWSVWVVTISSDSSATPTTTVFTSINIASNDRGTWSGIPIIKNDYYKVVAANPAYISSFSCFFHPMS